MNGAVLWAGVALASGAGAALRVLVDGLVRRRTRRALGTFSVNASGALALGLLVGAAAGSGPELVLATGLVGSYTTFSAWMLDALRLAERGRTAAALASVALQLAVGLAAAGAGWALAAAL